MPPPPEAEYAFVFEVKRTEADIEAAFLAKGGSLGSAAARAETDFALTHSERATSALVTETMKRIELPISPALLAMVAPEVRTAVVDGAQEAGNAGATIVLSSRARLNMTAARVGASINGTLVGTMSGQGSVLLKDLFRDAVPLAQLLEDGGLGPAELDQLRGMLAGGGGEPEDKENAAPAPAVGRMSDLLAYERIAENLKEVVDLMPVALKAEVNVPFENVPIKYSNWGTHQAVMGVINPRVVCKRHGATDEAIPGEDEVMSVVFYDDPSASKRLARVEPVLQTVYNAAWAKTEELVFAPTKNLTKSIMRVPVGYNASGYAPAAAVNDTPVAFPAETLEAILGACLAMEIPSADERKQVLANLSVPSVKWTVRYAPAFASAMSGFSAYTMPYRVDGTPVVLPDGVKMVQSESWRAEPVRSMLFADDCDGSACSAISVLKFAETMNRKATPETMAAHPHLRALANSLCAHYVYGTSVLAANAGHADAADEHAQKVAGHAIALALPKASFLIALDRGAHGYLRTGAKGAQEPEATPIVSEAYRGIVSQARFEALYPQELIERMPEAERKMFASFDLLKKLPIASAEYGLPPLAMEGTTLASSCLYTPDALQRDKKRAWYAMDKKIATSLSPNITRTHKSLDVGETGEHAFYMAKVELGVSMEHPLFRSPALRRLEQASAQYRFAVPTTSSSGVLAEAGATPKMLFTGEYAVVPLWEANESIAATLDEAHAEAHANVLPMRGTPLQLTDEDAAKLDQSLASLRTLSAHLSAAGKEEVDRHETQHVISFASLLSNPTAIASFVETVVDMPNAGGEVVGLDRILPGVAVHASAEQQEQQVGRMVVLNLLVPVDGATRAGVVEAWQAQKDASAAAEA